jgi:uncharacterized protein
LSGLPPHLQGLLRASAYPHAVESVELIETHISWVLLTGPFAYKIKRPVHYDFIDLTSAERRAFYCAEELRLNRRFAPELYLEVCDIRESPDGTRIGSEGEGRVLERCVRMRQFPSAQQLDRLLEANSIDPPALNAFGRALAQIHARLPLSLPSDSWGRADTIERVIRQNLEQYQRAAEPLTQGAAKQELAERLDSALMTMPSVMELRKSNGRIRECHGDLHARNIARLDTGLVAFDCIEFEPAFRWIDVAEEIALLLVDLASRDRPRHAHAFLSGYLAESGDYHACRMLPLYMAHRALVRAKVNAMQAARERHDRMLSEAQRALAPKSPRLILMSGLSGSGKTWFAERLAPELSAVHVRSDVERKRLAGLGAQDASQSGTGGGLYTEQNTAALYIHLARCAADALAGGFTVLLDATFLKRSMRDSFRALAQRAGVELEVFECEAPLDVLRERITRRRGDASEADLDVLEWQLREREPIGAEEGLRVTRVGPQPEPKSS